MKILEMPGCLWDFYEFPTLALGSESVIWLNLQSSFVEIYSRAKPDIFKKILSFEYFSNFTGFFWKLVTRKFPSPFAFFRVFSYFQDV